VYLPPKQLIFLLTGEKNPFSRFTHVAAGGPQNPTCGVGAQVVELLTTTEVPITLDQSHRHTIPRTQSSPAQSLSTRVTAPRTTHTDWTTAVSAPARCTNQDLISTKHRSRPKGRTYGRIASLPPTAPEADIKTFPSPRTPYIQSSSNPVLH